jgi:hypothetical protein
MGQFWHQGKPIPAPIRRLPAPVPTIARPDPLAGYIHPGHPLVVVLPFYHGDVDQAVGLLKWIAELGGVNRDCVLAFDQEAENSIELVLEAAHRAFSSVTTHRYRPPDSRVWPLGNNWMFTSVATYMKRRRRPWLLLETDAIPLRPDWVELYEAQYQRGQKPFMGHIVSGMGHMNGQGVYPADVARWTTLAFCPPRRWAWDIAMREETEAITHAANDIVGHVWAMTETNEPKMEGDGPAPSFPNQASVDRFITPGMATFHRNKDHTLIERLRERRARC